MKIMLLGAGGQLGQTLLRQAPHHPNHQICAYTQTQLNITRLSDIERMVHHDKPDLLINAAAYTQVDQAEKDEETAFLVNKEGAKHLALVCANANIPLIHVSTDYVFSGDNTRPYLETDVAQPINVYGQSKLEGERCIQALQPQHLILRVSGVFSPFKINFVKKMLELGQTKQTLNVVNDQFICPTSAADIANTLLEMAKALSSSKFCAWGTYHYCSKEITSWFEFARVIFDFARQHTSLTLHTLKPIPSEHYPTPAKRPRFSALNCEKLRRQFSLSQPSWHHSLPQVILELLRS